jgi:hypothetical protein
VALTNPKNDQKYESSQPIIPRVEKTLEKNKYAKPPASIYGNLH